MKLNYKQYGTGEPVLILHGLMGSLDNWQTIAKKLAENEFAVYTIDLRNHGKSPHSIEFSYELMCEDLLDFFKEHGIERASIIGHSMGGKVAMKFALTHPNFIQKLIVVDIAPVSYPDKHNIVFQALNHASAASAVSREEVLGKLRDVLDEESTIQFLMKNLQRSLHNSGAFEWKFNLPVLQQAYNLISKFDAGNLVFNGPALFIKGNRSDYISDEMFKASLVIFPNAKLVEINNSGHWVHAENPGDFVLATVDFLKT